MRRTDLTIVKCESIKSFRTDNRDYRFLLKSIVTRQTRNTYNAQGDPAESPREQQNGLWPFATYARKIAGLKAEMLKVKPSFGMWSTPFDIITGEYGVTFFDNVEGVI